MLSRKPAAAAAVLVALGLCAPASGQPSAPDPESGIEPGTGRTETAPAATGPAPPATPEEAAARREDRLDLLFARLGQADSDDWKRLQAEIRRLWSDSGSPSMDLLIGRAEQALEAGEPEVALRFLDDLVRLAPDFAEGWNRRATVYFMLGEYGRSVSDIERTLALEPRHFGALSGLAVILERLGDKEGAYQAYSEALAVHPNLPGAAEAVERLAPEVEGREL